jgi:hypothetical protein
VTLLEVLGAMQVSEFARWLCVALFVVLGIAVTRSLGD